MVITSDAHDQHIPQCWGLMCSTLGWAHLWDEGLELTSELGSKVVYIITPSEGSCWFTKLIWLPNREPPAGFNEWAMAPHRRSDTLPTLF